MRQRPSGPLLALLLRRLKGFDGRVLSARTRAGLDFRRALSGTVTIPGGAARHHTYWIVGVLTADPDRLIAACRKAGFVSTQHTSLSVVEAPSDRAHLHAGQACRLLSQMVVVPAYPELSDRARARLAAVVNRALRSRPGRKPIVTSKSAHCALETS